MNYDAKSNRVVKAPNPKLQIPKKLHGPNPNKAGSPLRSAPALHRRLTNDLQKLYADRTSRRRRWCLMVKCSRILRPIVPALRHWRGGVLGTRKFDKSSQSINFVL